MQRAVHQPYGWLDEVVKERLGWYRGVLQGRYSAKFLLCKQISCGGDPRLKSDGELWQEHGRLSSELSDAIGICVKGDSPNSHLLKPEFSFLDLKCELTHRILRKCIFCEWRCKVDRLANERGKGCGLDSKARVSAFFPHFGEEPPLVDQNGSGTIFFTSCNSHCVFCQNWSISQDPLDGMAVSARDVSGIIKSLCRDGVANINLVGGEPTPNTHVILEALNLTSTNVSILWNSNMYMTPETMQILADVVDIWLPDFKWGNDRCAAKYSRVPRYFEVTARNHLMAYRNGDMIVRHLVMPGHLECCTRPILDWVAGNCPRALVNVMGQYRPEHLVLQQSSEYLEIARRPGSWEVDEARRYADHLGLVWRPVS
ncbi:MAG TPA: radical SAM protein [Candidatus Acidoferrales bacterium]|nr:radical SAM protein [Candidatus Acidoferrales bacterium]